MQPDTAETVRTSEDSGGQLRVALCGSFHRDPAALVQTFECLRESFTVVSPAGVDWVDPAAAFVRLAHEHDLSVAAIERDHLAAMRTADFIWLFCPDGYVGTSAAMEIGFAGSAGIPVLTDAPLRDEVLSSLVRIVPGGIEAAAAYVDPDPGKALSALQQYYMRIAERRGWADESPRDTVLLITEELGELARAVRVESGLSRDGAFAGSAAEELADVQLYLVHLANALRIDLGDAVTAKEAINKKRAGDRERAA